jgi:uroporphyrin-III C-methyltransferase/precorrin-2 dehydrogenase/sirohydrochlorin ferrochelatase
MLGLTSADPRPAASQDGRLHAVTLLGGGPGSAELITVAGLKALMAADVVVADHLAPRDLIAELAPHVEVIDVSKHPRGRATAQQHINEVLVDRARAGKRVVRLKGGDGYVFGRGFEEVLAIREAGLAVRVIPGLTSPVAVPALAGIPLTHRGLVHEFTVVSGHLRPDHPGSLVDWTAVARMRGTLVLLMAVENAAAIAAVLLEGGRPADTPAAIICDGSLPTERTVRTTLGALGADVMTAFVRPPAIIVIGEVVALAS